jgi:hypothetical protein
MEQKIKIKNSLFLLFILVNLGAIINFDGLHGGIQVICQAGGGVLVSGGYSPAVHLHTWGCFLPCVKGLHAVYAG